MKDLKWFIGVLIALGVVWFITGGPERASSRDPFIHQPNPIGEGGTYNHGGLFRNFSIFPSSGLNVPQDNNELEDIIEDSNVNTVSPYSNGVTMSTSGARADEADDEYITLRIAQNISEPVLLDGWRLRSTVTGTDVLISGASYLPRLGGNNQEYTIRANPGDEIIITTGRSPIGVSFRTNECIGYLEQFQDFYPRLPQQCPYAEDEIPAQYEFGSGPNAFNEECMDIVERIGRCEINTQTLPIDIQPQCREFINKSLNYNGCVDLHSNDSDFYGDEWRVYLGRTQELWKERREVIELVDANNRVIDSVSY